MERRAAQLEVELRKLERQVRREEAQREREGEREERRREQASGSQASYIVRLKELELKTGRGKDASRQRAEELGREWARLVRLLEDERVGAGAGGGSEARLLAARLTTAACGGGGFSDVARAVLDRLRYCDRRHAQLQRRGDELAEAEARLNERLEGVKSKILAERAKMSRAF
mmetsp:Transcript_20157/g.59413  ORF Transcript_20157/g.59413 Transcript_20157/m.59413 type:complete len:173 (-) Transcript_20157:39-557(-)